LRWFTDRVTQFILEDEDSCGGASSRMVVPHPSVKSILVLSLILV
jgi:hypothetical protein